MSTPAFRGMSNFKALVSREENAKAATEWLGKALKMEAEGKGATMIEMALDRACMFELASFGIDPTK